MNVTIVAVGTKMPDWVEHACNEYKKRMVGICRLEFVEIPAIRRTKNADLVRIAEKEARTIEKKISQIPIVIALDRNGKTLSTKAFAARLQRWADEAQNVALVIGGPEGLSTEFLSNSSECWSLSAMTMAHSVARVMLAEQVYRAWGINTGLPYHRANVC